MQRVMKRQPRYSDSLVPATAREFDGGWNVIDSDFNLSSRFAKKLDNLYRAEDGSIQLRYGTALFAELPLAEQEVGINGHYFFRYLITTTSLGRVFATDGSGRSLEIWNDAIAAGLPANPKGWSATPFSSFSIFNGELSVHNGIDKPLVVRSNLQTEYIFDPANGTNINVPIGRYAATVGQYLVIAGDYERPDRIHISARNTMYAWAGDSGSDGINIDLGSRVPTGDYVIKGIGIYRGYLMVIFAECIIPIRLGIYDENGVHTPEISEAIETFGCVSHRSIQSLGDDLLFADIVGVPSVTLSKFSNLLTPSRTSQLIDPEIQKALARLNEVSQEDDIFAVYNRLEGQYILFVPDSPDPNGVSETIAFVFTNIRALKIAAWSRFRGWRWRWGCRSAEGRLFFGVDNRIYRYGSRLEPLHGDFIGEAEPWDDLTSFMDGSGWTPVSSPEYDTGVPISFDWIWPWTDLGDRVFSKSSKYLAMDTTGSARFNVDMFVDGLFVSPSWIGQPWLDGSYFSDNTGWDAETPLLSPALSMDFVAGEYGGYGADQYGQIYGGGRNTSDERLIRWPAKFNIAKFRIYGQAIRPLKFTSLTLLYAKGSIRRP